MLRNQFEDIPEDFFLDALSGDNFLRHMLKNFVLMQRDADEPIPASLKTRTDELLDHLRDRHRWDLRQEMGDLLAEDDISETGEYFYDDEELEPTVVELDDTENNDMDDTASS